MSLLLANGHSEARDYPLPMLAEEAEIIEKRNNMTIVTASIALHTAVSAVLSKDGFNAFKDMIDKLKRE